MTGSDNAYSFYLSKNNDFFDLGNKNIVAFMVCNGGKKWVESISLLMFLKKDIDSIKELMPPEIYPLGILHCDMKDIDSSIRDKLVKLTFKCKDDSHYYPLEDIAKHLNTLSYDDWTDLFSNEKKAKIVKKRMDRIIDTFYRDGGPYKIPSNLEKYYNELINE